MSEGLPSSQGPVLNQGGWGEPEIMAPVSDLEMVRAAVENGAGSVYAGMPGFNARAKTHGITMEELAAMSEYARLRGVRFYLAFNVVLFQRELLQLPDLLNRSLELVKPDAFIVQDPGLALILRELLHQTKLHASTQMTIASPETLEFYRDLGFDRVTLPRELDRSEIELFSRELLRKGGTAEIRASYQDGDHSVFPVPELEIFVHGALCISYSGQCFTSENFGGRSANRGQCAQSCRMEYELFVDGRRRVESTGFYPFSPRDLSLDGELEDLLVQAPGVRAIKIEGRSKSPEYVAAAVRKFKNLRRFDPVETSLTFAREKNSAWFHRRDDLSLVPGDFNSHRGIFLGKVHSVENGEILIQTDERLSRGDGVVFDVEGGSPPGGPVYDVTNHRKGMMGIRMAKDFSLARIGKGSRVYWTGSPSVEKELHRSYTDKESLKKIPLQIQVRLVTDERARVIVEDDLGNRVELQGDQVLEGARSNPATEESVKGELGALGGTVYSAHFSQVLIQGDPFVYSKELKLLRRSFCDRIDGLRMAGGEDPIPDPVQIDQIVKKYTTLSIEPGAAPLDGEGAGGTHKFPLLQIVLRNHRQLDLILEKLDGGSGGGKPGPLEPELYLDFPMGESISSGVAKLRERGHKAGIVTPRVLRISDGEFLERIDHLEFDHILSSSPGSFTHFRGGKAVLHGDGGLNVTNIPAARYFLERGIRSLTPSPDLSDGDLEDLIAGDLAPRMVLPVHTHPSGFYMEYCLYARFLAGVADSSQCDHICLKHHLDVKDHTGMLHSVRAEKNCRNTLHYGRPLSRLGEFDRWRKKGFLGFRLDFLDESEEEMNRILAAVWNP